MNEKIVYIITRNDYYDPDQAAKHCITVGELIDQLNDYDPEAKVVLCNDGGYTYGIVDEDTVTELK